MEKSYEKVKEGMEKLLELEVNEDFTEEKKGERIKKLKKNFIFMEKIKKHLTGILKYVYNHYCPN